MTSNDRTVFLWLTVLLFATPVGSLAETGAALLQILPKAADVQKSNFGKSAFLLTNTGDKDIVGFELDEDKVPLAITAAVIDPTNNDLPAGPVTAPIYMTFE